MPTEERNPRSTHLDELPTVDMLALINEEDTTVARAVQEAIPAIAQVVDAVADRFTRGGRLFYIGAGTSGRLGVLDASECPPTFSVEPGLFVGLIAGGDTALRRSSEKSEDSESQGAADLAAHAVTPSDTVVGIAASGRTPYVLGALAAINDIGGLSVALTCAGGVGRPPSRMAGLAQLAIELATGAEILTGSTRMKAGTATKLALNMISTGVMVKQGAVFGNLMVNVQPSNAKLADRARRILAEATGCTAERAGQLLSEAGTVKTAIVMELLGLPYAAASARLKRAKGVLREALKG